MSRNLVVDLFDKTVLVLKVCWVSFLASPKETVVIEYVVVCDSSVV